LSAQPLVPQPDPPALVRPEAIASIRRPGLIPRRLLVFGSGVLTGEGLANHDLGLPGAIADALAQASRRGVDITVIVDPDPISKRALTGLRGLRLRRFDAVIVILPALGARIPRPWRAQQVQRLQVLLAEECAEHSPAFIYDSPCASTDTAPARAADDVAQPPADDDSVTGTSRVRFRELPAQPAVLGLTPPFSPVTYESWAELIVRRLDLEIADLNATPRASSERPQNGTDEEETMRQQALQTLRLSNCDLDPALMSLLRQARVAFSSAGAALMIVEDEHVRAHAAVGVPPPTLSRTAAYSNIAIQSDRPTVISDAHRDPRVAALPGPEQSTRFYAGYPIHTWDGYRIGALCIYDEQPRDVRILDLVHLWEIAGHVEEHLWTTALRSGARPTGPARRTARTVRPQGTVEPGPQERRRSREALRRAIARLRLPTGAFLGRVRDRFGSSDPDPQPGEVQHPGSLSAESRSVTAPGRTHGP
jgi:hypothetical protein